MISVVRDLVPPLNRHLVVFCSKKNFPTFHSPNCIQTSVLASAKIEIERTSEGLAFTPAGAIYMGCLIFTELPIIQE